MGVEVEDYVACWMEILVDELGDADAKQVVLLGTDLQCPPKRPASEHS